MTALNHFRTPEVEVVGEGEVVVVSTHGWVDGTGRLLTSVSGASVQHSPENRAPVPLAIHHTPLCVTFAYFEKWELGILYSSIVATLC
jgi:exosome complex component RRP45